MKYTERISSKRSENPRVGGSIPSLATNVYKGLGRFFGIAFFRKCTHRAHRSKIFAIIALLLILSLTPASGGPIIPVAVARLCGNKVVHRDQVKAFTAAIRTEGCEEVYIVPLDDDYQLVYGIKILIGE